MTKDLVIIVTGFGILVGTDGGSSEREVTLLRVCSITGTPGNYELTPEPLALDLLDPSAGDVPVSIPRQVICSETRVPLDSRHGVVELYNDKWQQ